jgi:hypothetical protein
MTAAVTFTGVADAVGRDRALGLRDGEPLVRCQLGRGRDRDVAVTGKLETEVVRAAQAWAGPSRLHRRRSETLRARHRLTKFLLRNAADPSNFTQRRVAGTIGGRSEHLGRPRFWRSSVSLQQSHWWGGAEIALREAPSNPTDVEAASGTLTFHNQFIAPGSRRGQDAVPNFSLVQSSFPDGLSLRILYFD